MKRTAHEKNNTRGEQIALRWRMRATVHARRQMHISKRAAGEAGQARVTSRVARRRGRTAIRERGEPHGGARQKKLADRSSRAICATVTRMVSTPHQSSIQRILLNKFLPRAHIGERNVTLVKILRGNPLPALPRVTRRTTYFTAVSRLFPLRHYCNM